jgi:voltage-gated potassium channel
MFEPTVQPTTVCGRAFGFGDITAKSGTARVVLIVQMLADLALLGAGARVLLGAARRGRP